MNEKKRHHFVPVSYLNGFTDQAGKIFAYRKDKPKPPLHLKPDEIGFQNYYYSQPLPGGGRDNAAMEAAFGKIETGWPPLIHRLASQNPITSDLRTLFVFLLMMRVRVPAARDMVEASLAESVKSTARVMHKAGLLPPPPAGLEDILDHLVVSIDPHRSMLAMTDLAKGFSKVLDAVNVHIVRNETSVDFVTSDNPVCYFDPLSDYQSMRPYTVRPPDNAIELLFPISSKMLLRGFTKFDRQASSLQYVKVGSVREIDRINDIIARFSYSLIFARNESEENRVEKYHQISPVLKTTVKRQGSGEFLLFEHVFGPRSVKPKWQAP